MSTTTTTTAGTTSTRPRATGPTLPRVVAAEWSRATGLRSTAGIALATVAASGGLTALFAGAASGDPGFDPTRHLTEAVPLTSVGFLVLGVHLATADFRAGTFRTIFVAVPRRLTVLVAQVVVTALLASLLAVAAVGAAVAGVLPAASARGRDVDLVGGGTPPELVAVLVHLVAMALLGLGAGAVLRRTVPALLAVLGVALVLPVVLSVGADLASDPLAASRPPAAQVVDDVLAATPFAAGADLAEAAGSATAPEDALRPAAVLAGWVLVPLVAAAARLRRADLC